MLVRKAQKNDFKVISGLLEFIKSLELDIISNYGEKVVEKILIDCFHSAEDRFSYKFCNIVEKDNDIIGFSFSYNYEDVELAKKYWTEKIISNYKLTNETIIFDYDEALEEEFYLDTLYVFSEKRGQGIGTILLKQFIDDSTRVRSLNVAQSNLGARKLYESLGFKKSGEIYIGHEMYDHLIIK